MALLIRLAPFSEPPRDRLNNGRVYLCIVYLLDFPDMTWAEFHPILSLHKAFQGIDLVVQDS